MMKKVKIILSVILSLSLAACGGDAAVERHLTVSIEPQRFLLEAIAGPKWQVTSLLSRGEDPENFDPPVSALRSLYDSKAYFPVGTIEFEHHILQDTPGSPRVFDTSKGISLLSGTHSHHHSEECHEDDDDDGHDSHLHHQHETDPHIWGSLRNARTMAENMLEGLIEIDPADSAVYRANFLKLSLRLDSADAVISRNLAHFKGESFMVWHPSLSYFAADYGLNQLPLGLDNKEMSVRAFRTNIDRARQKGARVFLVQPGFDAGQSVGIAAQAGVPNYSANTLAYDFIDELIRVSRLIANPQAQQK